MRFLFSSRILCCCFRVPRWEREQCLSEINTTQGEPGESEADRQLEQESERREGWIKEDGADKHRSDF